MQLQLFRRPATAFSVIGELYVNGKYQCYTLEDPPREVKVPGKTGIPAGKYGIVITPSIRFKRDLPLLLDVPGFTGVRIHYGNTAADTEGCILVGTMAGRDMVMNSRAAFDPLFVAMQMAWDRDEELEIDIKEAQLA